MLYRFLSYFILVTAAAAAAKSLQSCLTLCDPINSSLPGPPVPGILQARTLEWVAISFSNARKWKVKVKLSRVRLLASPWTAAPQAPPSMGFSRQEDWSGEPLPSYNNFNWVFHTGFSPCKGSLFKPNPATSVLPTNCCSFSKILFSLCATMDIHNFTTAFNYNVS